jgi:hypothetical protein
VADLTDEQLRQIARQLRGPQPELVLPAAFRPSQATPPAKQGARFIIAPGRAELDTRATASEFWSLLEQQPAPQAVVLLSALNSVVEAITHRDPLHVRMTQSYVSPDRIARIKKLILDSPPAPDAVEIFNRWNLLLLERLVLLVPGDPSKSQQTPLATLGELALIANDYMTGQQLRLAMSHESTDYVPFMVDFVGSWDIANPPDVAYGLARAYRLLKVHLFSDRPEVKTIRDQLPVNLGDVKPAGISVDEFIACAVGIYSWLKKLSPQELIDRKTSGVLNLKTYLGDTKLDPQVFKSFVDSVGLSPAEFRKRLAPGDLAGPDALDTCLKTDRFLTDLLELRSHPLCRISDDQAVCLDARFLTDLVITGLYWRFIDALNSIDKKAGDSFSELWGHACELHVAEMLQHFYPGKLSPLRLNIAHSGGEVDALLDFGTDVVLIEVKSSLMKVAAKNNRDRAAFEQEFGLKYVTDAKGSKKAIRQLAAGVVAARSGELGLSHSSPRVYPVFVGYDLALDSFWINRYADDLFRTFVPKDVVSRPLTVMSAETLETIVPHFASGDLTWPELLEKRFFGPDSKVVDYSVFQALHDWREEHQTKRHLNDFMHVAYQKVFETTLSAFRGEIGAAASAVGTPAP